MHICSVWLLQILELVTQLVLLLFVGDDEVLYIKKEEIEHRATKHLIDLTLSSLKGCTDSVIRFLVDYNSNGK